MEDKELRDVFAMQALSGMLASGSWLTSRGWETPEQMTADYSREAYLFADAMLKERSK
jgi:hypothetical protein